MRLYLLALVCMCAIADELTASHSSSEAWRLYKRQYGKVYEAEEDAMRFANFLTTKQLVERHNANPNATYKMRLNHMADWSHEEYRPSNNLNVKETKDWVRSLSGNSSPNSNFSKLLAGPAPKEVDWRMVPNRVSPVGDRKSCGSSWAFAATGVLEGQQVKRNISKLIPLSAQELIDCSGIWNDGCDSGAASFALYAISQTIGGIVSEADYPYDGEQRQCRLKGKKFVPNMYCKDPGFVNMGDEYELLLALANYGPVAVGFDASKNFMSYHSGVFDDSTCTNNPEHGYYNALAVGYGTDPKDGDYWIIKNSMGVNWGEEGYMRIKRGVNMCGIGNLGVIAQF